VEFWCCVVRELRRLPENILFVAAEIAYFCVMTGFGILPSQTIRTLIEGGAISAAAPIAAGQIQPASLDLRLGRRAFRVRASFMPGPNSKTDEQIERFVLHTIDLSQGAVLEVGCVYVAEIEEALALPSNLAGFANPKSSTGRLDVFTRVIADHAPGFDQTGDGYRGRLYLEICPQTFPILVRSGSRLSQMRFRAVDAGETRATSDQPREVILSVDLSGGGPYPLIGYRAKRHTGVIDVDRVGAYDVDDFWEPLLVTPQKRLILDPDEFYILASKEAVRVPPTHAAEMEPFNALMGEFRVHYAGFFDPGFGMLETGGQGSRAVLEVRSHKVPFILEDGQLIGRLIYERLSEEPAQLYGQDIGSHYQAQALKLSKHFR
jgi:dCTP deaminase